MTKWTAQEAEARFSDLEATLTQGPQAITKGGVEAAVLVPMAEWQRLQRSSERSALEVLLGDGPRLAIELPTRGPWNWRVDRVDLA